MSDLSRLEAELRAHEEAERERELDALEEMAHENERGSIVRVSRAGVGSRLTELRPAPKPRQSTAGGAISFPANPAIRPCHRPTRQDSP
jgi:hypothetical protein